MWSLRKHRPIADRQQNEQAAAIQTVPAPPRHVGAVLRRAREALGEDIRLSAAYLKIRETYLRAIEDGRFEDLPGHAYAIGFVRAYAVHLNLDGEKIVQRFKEEAAGGIDPKPELTIPVPPGESRRPGAALVLTSLILAIGAYGGWYYLSTQGRLVTESPSIDLPAKPLAVAETPPPARTPAPSTKAQPEPVAVARPPASPPSIAPPPSAPMPAPEPVQAASRPVMPLSETPGAQDSDDAEVAEIPPEPEPIRTPAMGSQMAAAPIAGAPAAVLQGTPPNTSFDRQLQDAMVRPPISASSANAATIDPPATKPATPSGPSRVMIHAIADSWLQVGDGRSPAIFMQVLRAGETYSVPDRPGLRFDTGNAGGLEITVDGKPTPPVGPSGAVRRNISLDADKLLAGTVSQR